MVNPNMAGEDASLDASVAAIAAKLKGDGGEFADTRENREQRDPIERQQTSDLEESERLEREAQAEQDEGESPPEAEAEAAEKVEDDAEAFIELPPAEEGKEAERIPVNEAVEAVKQLRQLQGDIATAVIKAEEEAYQKQDQITASIAATLTELKTQAKATLMAMQRMFPAEPDTRLLDGPDENAREYWIQRNYYDAFVQQYNYTLNTLKQAEAGSATTASHQDTEWARRESERTARFIPEWKEPAKRDAWKAEALELLGQRYGVTKEMLDETVDHRALRIVNDLVKTLKAERKAPEVKKHLQETKPKIVNGRASPARDNQTGRFVGDAKKALKSQGTEEAFARYLMRSGGLKDLL